ncbi:hypothetical protein Q2407_26050, partial [Escherichia coli]|nr:hypothetical protein [Escherichia coli]
VGSEMRIRDSRERAILDLVVELGVVTGLAIGLLIYWVVAGVLLILSLMQICRCRCLLYTF